MANQTRVINWWIILAIISGVLILADYNNYAQPLWKSTEQVTVNVKQFIWSQQNQLAHKFDWWNYWRQGQSELQTLRRAYQKQATISAKLNQLQQENQQLRQLLGADFPSNWKFTPVLVIGRSGQQIIINQGSSHGIQTGMMAVIEPDQNSNQGILIGQISQVHPRQSWVTTINHPNLRIPIQIIDSQTAQNTATGLLINQNGQLKVDKLLPDEEIQVGDIVTTKGQTDTANDSIWLPDIPIGVITQVKFEKETDLYQQAQVNWLANDRQIENIFVITDW